MWAIGPKGVTHLQPLHSTDFSLLGCLILFPFLLILFIPFYIETLGLNCFQLFNIKIIQIRTLFVVQDSCLSRVFLPVLRVHQSPLVSCLEIQLATLPRLLCSCRAKGRRWECVHHFQPAEWPLR